VGCTFSSDAHCQCPAEGRAHFWGVQLSLSLYLLLREIVNLLPLPFRHFRWTSFLQTSNINPKSQKFWANSCACSRHLTTPPIVFATRPPPLYPDTDGQPPTPATPSLFPTTRNYRECSSSLLRCVPHKRKRDLPLTRIPAEHIKSRFALLLNFSSQLPFILQC